MARKTGRPKLKPKPKAKQRKPAPKMKPAPKRKPSLPSTVMPTPSLSVPEIPGVVTVVPDPFR